MSDTDLDMLITESEVEADEFVAKHKATGRFCMRADVHVQEQGVSIAACGDKTLVLQAIKENANKNESDSVD